MMPRHILVAMFALLTACGGGGGSGADIGPGDTEGLDLRLVDSLDLAEARGGDDAGGDGGAADAGDAGAADAGETGPDGLDQDGADGDGLGETALPPADPCAEENGGCGEAALFECVHLPGGEPQCMDRCDVGYAALAEGVESVDQGQALPSMLVVHGPRACPLVVDEGGRTMVAFAGFGDGRVIHAGHEALVVSPSGGAALLVLNSVRWLGRSDSPTVGIEAGAGGPKVLLEGAGIPVSTVTLENLESVDVLVTNSYIERSDADVEKLKDWVYGGGGLLQGGHAWWWSYSHEDVFNDYPGNRLVNEMGITVTASTDASAGIDAVPAIPPSPLLHAYRALLAVAWHIDGSQPLAAGDQSLAAGTIISAVSQLPLTFDQYYGPVQEVLGSLPATCPTKAHPLSPGDEPISALVVTLLTKLAAELPPAEVKPIECDFPGPLVEGAIPVTRTITLDASYSGMDPDYWFAGAGAPRLLGTGLYAGPGAPVTVTVPPGWASKGLGIRISPFTDLLWGAKSWTRFPSVSRLYEVEQESFLVASAFGGPVYLEVPAGTALGSGEVTLEGAYPMARYVHGKTADFAAQLAESPAPVVELESDRLVLTVLRKEMTQGTDPVALMTFWNEVLDADADLAAIPHARPRAERIAVDRQISAGWMHSGYPVMAYDWAGPLTDIGYLTGEAEWGAFHELGHNHQYGPAVLPGTIESTCNLFSVYVSENVVGIDRSLAHPALKPGQREATIAAYVAGGLDFWSDWNVWTALETYLQLQEAFGWSPLIAANAAYLAMAPGEKPQTDADRIDRWVVISSQAAGFDLVPFYLAWGFPVSAAAQDEVAGLPPWTDHPMVGWQ